MNEFRRRRRRNGGASEQITEVYEYMTGETGMTKMKKDEVVRDKEIVLIVMEKQKEVSQAEKEHV